MSWNNGRERKLFENRQRVLAEQYRNAGMTEEQIQNMYKFDLDVFKSERVYYTHAKALEFCSDRNNEAAWNISNFLSECQAGNLINYFNRYWWIDELEELCYAVKALSDEEKELITLYFFEGYTQKEIADIHKCAHNTVSYRLTKIKSKLLSAKGGEKDEK